MTLSLFRIDLFYPWSQSLFVLPILPAEVGEGDIWTTGRITLPAAELKREHNGFAPTFLL